MIDVIYKSKNAIAVNKPFGMPSERDPSGDPDAMTVTGRCLEDVGEDGRLWLVHRIDRVVGGALIFARTKAMASALSEIIRDRQIAKEYIAVVEGRADDGTLVNLLYKDARQGKSFVVDRERQGVKEARLTYRALETVSTDRGDRTLVKVTLDTGRFHQIRAQMSHIGLPIVGDGKYGSREKIKTGIALFSARVAVTALKEKIDARILPDKSEYPWSLFNFNEEDLV